MSDRKILQALQKRLIETVDNVLSLDLPVKYLGRTFQIPDNQQWLEVIFIPNNIPNEFWAGGKTFQGFFRLILHTPINDEGVYDSMDLLEQITSVGFEKGENLYADGITITITDNPDLTGVIEEPPEIYYPATISYTYYKQSS